MFDRLSNDLRARILRQKASGRSFTPYAVPTIDLTTARTNVEFRIGGDNLTVTLLDGTATIRFNNPESDEIALENAMHFPYPTDFYRFFITNGAQAGLTLRMVVGRDLGLQLVRNAAVLAASAAVIGSIGGLGIHVGATPRIIASGAADALIVAATPNLRLVGYSITESAGPAAVAEVSIQHGVAADIATELFGITLAADESARDWFGPEGIAVPSGLFLDRLSGSTKATIYTKTVA